MTSLLRFETRRRFGEIGWTLAPGMEEALAPLLQEMGQPLGRHERSARGEDAEGHTIFTLKTNRPGLAGELFVKVYHHRGLEAMFGRGDAAREWRMARDYERRGLPIASHLARGVRRQGGWIRDEYLVQESLLAYESFEVFFRNTFRPELPGVRPQDKRLMIKELAGLIRRMHDRGVSRPDLQPRNIMAASRAGGGIKFVFVDLDRSRLRSGGEDFSREDRVAELARFHINFAPLFSQGYLIRFYAEYFAPDRLSRQEFRRRVKSIVERATELGRKQERQVVRGVLRRKGPFFWFNTNKYRVFLRKPLYQNSLLEAVAQLPAAEHQARIKVKQVGGLPPQELILIKCAAEKAAGMCSAQWAFLVSAVMDYHGMPQFRVMAAVEPRGGDEGYYLTVQPGKGEHYLAEYLARRVAEEFSGLAWDRGFLVRIARFLLRLHELGWYFPAPSGQDLWVRYGEDGTHELRLFNLHRLRRIEASDRSVLLRNLFDLWRVLPISQADGQLLAEEYLRFSRAFADDRRDWLQRFMQWQMESVNQ